MNSTEVWKDVEGFEGLYQVSNMGRVRSLDRKDEIGRTVNERVLAGWYDNHGYRVVTLHRDGNTKKWRVHRLVAIAFLDNPDNLPEINHKDEDKANNVVSNLEWCSSEYNANYGTRNERMAKAKERPIYVVSGSGHRYFFNSTKKASELLGLNQSNVSKCLRGKVKHHHGFSFMWAV
ncbi:NUMOD4 domain-containing protein [Lacticaseibacillus paracasei]|uniref:NUMOD4 domain-containing protein n=1 Tax=Lacticaseibacillus paracasei TaxID=1597 RepID=UPI001F50EA8C|nr:NUMOD4 domain-containing protein [Lacticaseibacillus paracasei]MCI0374689.1 HNH endonuclease [Lacticaseibacillus paracasei]MCP9305476.1 HNH endonuclease [Lacticaseibacillus paracasei]